MMTISEVWRQITAISGTDKQVQVVVNGDCEDGDVLDITAVSTNHPLLPNSVVLVATKADL